jgi:hypothetical protein
MYLYTYMHTYIEHTQKNGAVSEIDKFIFQPTWARHTLSATRTFQVSHALPAVPKMASQQEKAFCVLRCEVSSSVTTVHETHAALESSRC